MLMKMIMNYLKIYYFARELHSELFKVNIKAKLLQSISPPRITEHVAISAKTYYNYTPGVINSYCPLWKASMEELSSAISSAPSYRT